jgi:DNA polymerase V
VKLSARPTPAAVSTYPKRPLSAVAVRAGFPSPADDHLEKRLDLAELVGIRSPDAVFFIRAEGDSMTEAGIHDGDTMVIDRSVEPGDGHVVVAEMAGEFVVKVLRKKRGKLFLEPASKNPRYTPVEVTDLEGQVWGVVTAAVRPLKRL